MEKNKNRHFFAISIKTFFTDEVKVRHGLFCDIWLRLDNTFYVPVIQGDGLITVTIVATIKV